MYEAIIRRIDPTVTVTVTVTEAEAEAEGIVASMRLQYSTLDPLPAATFHEEIEAGAAGIPRDLRGWLGRRERRALGRAEARADRVVLVPAAGGAVRDVRAAPRRAGGVDVEVRAGRGGWDGFASGGAAHPARPGAGAQRAGGRAMRELTGLDGFALALVALAFAYFLIKLLDFPRRRR